MCPEPASPLLPDARVLVVDSDPPSARLIQAVLEQEGCTLRVASSGRDALRTVADFAPHLVLVELVLPDLVGLDLVKLLKADAAAKNAVIVAVTASNGPETRRLALEAGCVDYVRKPIDALTFAARLHSHLGRHVEPAAASKRGPEA